MRIAAITVKNFRSITKAHKLQLGPSTILIGKNNEGKSNILRALVIGLKFLIGSTFSRAGQAGPIYLVRHQVTALREGYYGREGHYNWEIDFPIGLQASHPEGQSEVTLDFELDRSELAAFKKAIGSKLNGNLPIKLTFGRERARAAIVKQGPGAEGLTKKSEQIAAFIQKRLDFEYIPAVRTAQSAHEVVDGILAAALRRVESESRYKQALKAIEDLQKPVLADISRSIEETLKLFLPAITRVEVGIASGERSRALRAMSQITIDDGTPTALRYKGDGVQSLAAIALMRHAAAGESKGKHTLIALAGC